MTKQDPNAVEPGERNPLERLGASFREEVDQLLEMELDVEELAERKAALLRQYIKDDVHGARRFWEDLKGEMDTLEEFLGQWLLQAADPTRLDWAKLNRYIQHKDDLLMAGEHIADAELACVGCGKIRVVEGDQRLAACTDCGSELYQIRQRV